MKTATATRAAIADAISAAVAAVAAVAALADCASRLARIAGAPDADEAEHARAAAIGLALNARSIVGMARGLALEAEDVRLAALEAHHTHA